MGKHRINRLSRTQTTGAAVGLAAATVAGTLLVGAGPASAATSQSIISQPHSVQRACAERIYAAQGSGAWTGWSGSLDNMTRESGDSDTAVNSSSGAAGYYQIMPSTWSYLCSDLSGGSVSSTPSTVTHSSTRTYSSTRSYTAASQPAATTVRTSSVATSYRGGYVYSSHVQAIQRLLQSKGYSVGPEGADGLLGPHTEAGVRAFQISHGLVVDGIPGVHTWAALTS